MYTTEATLRPDRNFIELNLTWTNPASTFSLQESFQSVGGLSPGQEPFVVALTTAGLFEFMPFGASAGAMAGPFQVTGPSSDAGLYYTSLPQRVVRNMKTKRWSDKDALAVEWNATGDRIVGGSTTAVAVVVFLGVLGWRKLRHRKRRQIRKEEAEAMETMTAIMRGGRGAGPFSPTQDPTAPPLMSSEKHEDYSTGMIVEEFKDVDEDKLSSNGALSSGGGRSSNGGIKRSNSPALSVSKQPMIQTDTGSVPSYTYQDQIKELDFSHHPRPNVVTTVGHQDTK